MESILQKKRTMEVLDEIQEVYEACESMRYTSAGLTALGVTYGNAFTDNIDVIMEAVKNYTNEISRALVFQMPADPEAEKNMKAVPIELKDAQNYINTYHRHHQAAHRDKFRIAAEKNGEIVGVIQVGRPVSRVLDDGKTLEVLRLCTNGEKDVCSFLYAKAARIAKELGYSKIVTYILESEPGTSLKVAGWLLEKDQVGGSDWNTPCRPRELYDSQLSLFPTKPKYPIDQRKQRWCKILMEVK